MTATESQMQKDMVQIYSQAPLLPPQSCPADPNSAWEVHSGDTHVLGAHPWVHVPVPSSTPEPLSRATEECLQ